MFECLPHLGVLSEFRSLLSSHLFTYVPTIVLYVRMSEDTLLCRMPGVLKYITNIEETEQKDEFLPRMSWKNREQEKSRKLSFLQGNPTLIFPSELPPPRSKFATFTCHRLPFFDYYYFLALNDLFVWIHDVTPTFPRPDRLPIPRACDTACCLMVCDIHDMLYSKRMNNLFMTVFSWEIWGTLCIFLWW